MQKDAIDKIKAAEAEAAAIKTAAAVRVKEMLDKAHEEGRARKRAATDTADREADLIRGSIAEESNRLLSSSVAEAQKEAEVLKTAAEAKVLDAVDRIVWGIIEQWQ